MTILKRLITAHCPLSTALLLLLFNTSAAFAKGEVHPRLSIREEYNDNVFLESDNERGDFITTVAPGISALWETKALRLDLDYGFRFRIYERFDEKSETSLRDTQRALGRIELFPGRDFSVAVIDEYSRVTVDPRGPVAEGNDFVNKTNRNRLDVNPRYRFARKTWNAVLGYGYENLAYDAPEGDDSEAHRVTIDLEKALSSRLALLVSGAGEDRRFEERADFRRGDASAGFGWRPSERLTLTAVAGLTRIDYEESENRLPGERDSRSAHWRASGTYHIRPTLAATASYGQSVDLSVNEGLFKTRNATAGIVHRGKTTADLTFRAREDDYLAIQRRDRSVGAALGVTVPFGKALALALRGDIERVAFQPEDEDAWRTRGTAALSWTGRKITLTGGYEASAENSDIDANDYVNTIVYLQGGVRF